MGEEWIKEITRETGLDIATIQESAKTAKQAEKEMTALTGENALLKSGRSREMQKEQAQAGPVSPVLANRQLLENNQSFAIIFLGLMEHFAGLHLTSEIQKAGQGGLTMEELNSMIGSDTHLQLFKALITQGFQEFLTAGGSELSHYERLEETILLSNLYGEPYCLARNQLQIGEGWPERGQIGIIECTSRLLSCND